MSPHLRHAGRLLVDLPAVGVAAFPNGVAHYAASGVLIGRGIVVIYLSAGTIVGACTFLGTSLQAWWRSLPIASRVGSPRSPTERSPDRP